MEIEERRKIEYNLCGYLKTYIKKLCKDNGNINDIIERTGICTLIDFEDLDSFGLDSIQVLREKKNILLLKQKRRNKIYLREIKQLASLAEKEGLMLIFLKGILLAKELYVDSDIRLSEDIDILIDKKKELEYRSLLSRLGYETKGNQDISISHIVYTKQLADITVQVEVHGYIMNPPSLFLDFSDLFFCNINKICYENNEFSVLDTEYNLVYLTLNFYKSLPLGYFENSLYKKKTTINLSKLHDLALMITTQRINWEKVIYLCESIEVPRFVYQTLIFLNEIYENIVPGEVLHRLLYSNAGDYISEKKLERWGEGKFLWIFQKICYKLHECKLQQLITSDFPYSFKLLDYVGSKRILFNNIYCKNYTLNIRSENIKIKVSIKVINEGIDIQLQCDGKSCCLYDFEGELFDKDSIEIILLINNCIIHRMFTLSQLGNRVGIIQSSYNDNHVYLRNENCNYKVKPRWFFG